MSITYNNARRAFLAQELDWTTATEKWKTMLVTTGYVADADHDYVSDVNAYEASGVGYVPNFGGAGRLVLSGRTLTVNDPTNKIYVIADTQVWSAINAGNIAGAIIFWEVTEDEDSPVFAFIDGGGFPVQTNGVDLTVAWAASGIINVV